MKRTRLMLWAVVALAGVIAAGCSDDSAVQADRAGSPTAVPAPAGIGDGGALLTLETVDAGSISGLITDHRGRVVYGNSVDRPGDYACVDDCLSSWMPLTERDAAVSSRLDLAKYAVVTRPDGIEQVTYDGVALYTWASDVEVGEPNGVGVAGIWFALTADGTFVR